MPVFIQIKGEDANLKQIADDHTLAQITISLGSLDEFLDYIENHEIETDEWEVEAY